MITLLDNTRNQSAQRKSTECCIEKSSTGLLATLHSSLPGRKKQFYQSIGVLFFILMNASFSLGQGSIQHCKFTCRDTTVCYSVPDSAVHPPVPTYGDRGPAGGFIPCPFDSMWNNSPGVFPVGITVVTWYVIFNGQLDSCTENIIRTPPSAYTIKFSTFPPIIGGVINICNGQSITFTDSSIGTTGRLWNFGNGYYSSNAVHTEPASHYPPGTYYDTLTIYDACGVAHDTAFQVIVDSSSGPDIYCISVVCPGDTVTYRTHASCTGYSWSVTGGTFLTLPTATSDSATIIWGAGPMGTITLTVTGCTPPLTCPLGTTVNVHIVPATLPIRGDTIVCSGGMTCYSIECIPGNNHNWELLPANAYDTITGLGTCQVCIKWKPTFFGVVTLVVNYQNVLTGSGCNLPNGCTSDHGCGGTGTITIHVRPLFGISGPSKVCPNALSAPFNGMNLTNNTIVPGVTWKVVTPVPSTFTFLNSTAFNTGFFWNAGPGTYTVTAYAPPNIYCTDSAVKLVEVVDMKTPNNITGPDTVCKNDTVLYSTAPNMGGVTYTWFVSGGTIIGPTNGSAVFIKWNLGGGTVSVLQTLSTSPGCVSLVSAVFTVKTWPNFPLPVITPSAINVCIKSNVTYSIPPLLLSNASYIWSVVPATAGNIITANGTNTITIHWINAATPPKVKLKITRCYEDSVLLPVNLLPLPPVPNITYSPLNPCKNTLVIFNTSSPGPLWNWSFGDGGIAGTQTAPYIYTTAGDFTVQLYVTNTNGCSDTAKTSIHVNDIPVVPVITGPSSVCVNSPTTHTFSQPLFVGASYTWSLSAPALGGITSSNNTAINVLWSIPGVDTIKLHIQSTCLDTTVKYIVTVHAFPTPGITGPSSACQGATVTFSTGVAANYSWNFSGGVPSSTTVQSPTVTYALPNTYPVTLSVINTFGCAGTANTSITIHPLPLAVITGPFQVCSFPATVTLSAVNIGGNSYAWSPPPVSGTPSITRTINASTLFFVTVTNGFSCSQISNAILVDTSHCPPPDTLGCFVVPKIDFTHTPATCLTQTFTKTGTDTLTGWNFGDGGTAGNTNPVTHTYIYPGVYLVQVQGTAHGFDNNGLPCTKITTNSHLDTIPFDAKFDYSFQCTGTNQMQTILTNTSLYLGNAASYTWQWKDLTTVTVLSNVAFPPAQLLTPGTHTIALYINDPVTLSTCTLTKVIIVPAPIIANFSISTPVCVGSPSIFIDTSTNVVDEVSRLFNNNNAATSTLSPCSLVYINSGPFFPFLTVTDKYGCTNTNTKSIIVSPAGTGTITVTNSCDSVKLQASGPGPFTWNVITPPPFPTNPVYVKTSGFYSVTSTPVGSCPYTAGPVQVTVNKSPNATVSGQTQYCQGENLDIKTSAAGINFSWVLLPSTPVGGNSPNLTAPAGQGFPGTFTYQVTVQGLNGCFATATYTITVDPVPAAATIVGFPLTFCDGDSVTLTVSPPGATYLWSKTPGPALTPPQNANDSLFVKVSGTYAVIVQTISGCAYPAITPVTITVNPSPPALIAGDTVLCVGDVMKLKTIPVGGASYVWTGPFAAGNSNPFIKANMQLSDSGYYTVAVTNAFGCTTIDSVYVIVHPTPAPPFIIPAGSLCEGVLHTLCVQSPLGPPIVYNWNTGQIGNCITTARTGDYTVTAINQYGCSALSNTITIHPLPDLSCIATGCYEFCIECDTVTIPGPVGLASYDWEILVGNIFTFYSAAQNLAVIPPGGIFRLVGANQWGCTDSTDTLKIDFHTCCSPFDSTACIDTCINFDNNSLNGWQPNPSAPNVGLVVTNALSQRGAVDYFLRANDLPGPSQLLAGSQFTGHWCCGDFCYDYRMFDDGVAGTQNINPVFVISNGVKSFSFTSSVIATETNGWHHICAPISDCGMPPPSLSGVWAPLAGTVPADWNTVVSFVTQVIFKVDYTAAPSEVSGFDNACLKPNVPNINAGPDQHICKGGVAILHVTGCNGTPQWYELNGGVNFNIGNGQGIDVSPQQTTCYMVICCGAGACCCDTDTVCVIVNPLPILKWPVNYNVCLNSDSIYLDTANISVYVNGNWIPVNANGGTGIFVGPGVIGNYFYPNTLGTHVITYYYTDSLGCTGLVSITINVIFCCGVSCHVNAGNDTTICAGGTIVLQAQGCSGTTTWYDLNGDPAGGGPVVIGQGPEIGVHPTQSTCYIAICCCQIGGITCCDTDTVCITVRPLPHLDWPVQFQDVCLYSDSIFLDPANIFVLINNIQVPITSTNGTWYFSGVGVVGNYFHPTTLGLHIITLYYTDSLGCTGQVSITINVIFCCGVSCQVNAGNDTTICAGSAATLHATGCSGTLTWYALNPDGPVMVGQEPEIVVHPTQSTCYIAICCCLIGGISCCDTDTVCITVRPLPHLDWPVQFQNVCLNSDSIFLDPANIFVMINNIQVPITSTNGTWYFSGTGVVGNYFHPTTLGIHVITLYYTDSLGCTGFVTISINVVNCGCNVITCNCNAVPPPPLPTITVIGVVADSCNQSGCIHIVFTGCCLLYSYTYNDPCNPLLSYSVAQTPDSSIFCHLRAGTYTIYVQDACGNLVSRNVTVPSVNGPLIATVQYSNCGHRICVNAEGGCPPYIYNWLGGNTTNCFTGNAPCVDTYVTITDSRGCSITINVTIPDISFVNVVHPSCCGANGSICANVCFGQTPYSYLWSNGGTTQCISGLAAGVYCVTITNRNGNQFSCCYTLTNAVATTPNVSFIFNNCGAGVTAVVGGGCENYTHHWENNSTELIRNNLTPCDTLTFTLIGCDGAVYHYGFRVPHLFPTITPVNCFTGRGVICVPMDCFRCSPYTYSWSPAVAGSPNNTSCYVCPPGHYTVCITNSCGDVICCDVYLPPPINIIIDNFYPQGCPGNVISIIGSGFADATDVLFNGMSAASFVVNNDGDIDAEVPVGASTGPIIVVRGPCSGISATPFTVTSCNVTLNIKVFIEGFYIGNGEMVPVLYHSGLNSDPTACDSIIVELHDGLAPTGVVFTATGLLHTDGTAEIAFPPSVMNGTYYIAVRHRNALETWSKNAVLINSSTLSFDFTSP